jgi:hypothetical protein
MFSRPDGHGEGGSVIPYGFYTRIATIDRTTYEPAAWAKDEADTLTNVPAHAPHGGLAG